MAQIPQQTQELFAQIGNRLKAAREAAGYTLQELSAHTRINLMFLERIEAGDLAGLPGMAFVKGFIRNYIQVLQIDDPELDEELRRLTPEENLAQPQQIRPSNPQVLETDEPRISYAKMALFAGLAVLIVWVGYVLLRGSDEPPPAARVATTEVAEPAAAGGPGAPAGEAATPPVADTPAEAGPGEPAADAPEASATTSGTAPEAATPAPPEPGATTTPPPTSTVGVPRGAQTAPPVRPGAPLEGRQKLELTIRGLERTWVRLSIDRAPPIDVLMQPAETVAWEANQEIRLTIGKSHGVAVYLNGEEILLPQESNRLIPNLVLNKLTLLRLEN